MITREIIEFINQKIRSVIIYLVIIGLFFFLLAAAIMFYPEILQVVFVLSFFVVSFSAFLIAAKIKNIKDSIDKVLLLLPKKRKKG